MSHTEEPTIRLYHHQTDGGAEYLCAQPVEGTDEGDISTTVARLDGIPEIFPLYAAAPELFQILREIYDHAQKYGGAPWSATKMFSRARTAIDHAEGRP